MPRLALEVEIVAEPDGNAEVPVAAPFADPGAATERSCSMSSPGTGRGWASWLLLGIGLCAARRRR
jgi:MYXO-CTERM domain-containing protein